MSDARTVHERMVAILKELPAIGKTTKNTQQNFMFRSHDDVLNALNPKLAEHGVYFMPDVLERVTALRTTKGGGTMYEVNLHVRFTFYGAAGDSVTASTWGEGTDLGDKATNKAMTMALKNALNQAFAISTAEFGDPDAETPEATEAKPAGRKRAAAPRSQPSPSPGPPEPSQEQKDAFYKPVPITDQQRRHLYALFTEKNILERDAQLAFCTQALGRTIESSKEMGKAEATAVIRQLEEYDPENPHTYPFPSAE